MLEMTDYGRARWSEGYNVIDAAPINTTATQQEYYIGTLQVLANPTKYPGMLVNSTGGPNHPGFDAQQLLFYATEDTYVRFNDPNNLQIPILAGMLIAIPLKTSVIYVQRVTVNGILYVWAVG